MDTIFSRKKLKPQPRQSSFSNQDLNEHSVPYDQLGPSPRSPVAVGTISQGINHISAPLTNPTLTPNGTELNKFALQRAKAERSRAYAKQLNDLAPPQSPTFSADSLYSDSVASSSSASRPSFVSSIRNVRQSEASSISDPPVADFGQISPSNNPPSYFSTPNATIRPTSTNTTRSEGTRGSKYASSVVSSDALSPTSHHSHLSHFHFHSRHDDFQFPRPETDEEIEAMFENLKRTREFPEMPHLSIDQKWHMVYGDEQIRWKERDDNAKKQMAAAGQGPGAVEGSPEWYIKKFLDQTITAKQAGSLLVSLRSKEMR
jgi:cytokinesis protein